MRARSGRRRTTAARDLLLILLGVAVVIALGRAGGLFEAGYVWLDVHAHGDLGETIAALLLLAVGLAIFTFGQWRAARTELASRQEAEDRFRTLVEEVPAVIYTWDPRRPTGSAPSIYVSPQVEQVMGFTAEEWTSDPGLWIRQIHPEDRERVLAATEHADHTGEPLGVEYRHVRPDGSTIWIREEAVVIERDEQRRPSLVQGIMYDITERKQAERDLEEAEGRYRTLVEQLPVVVYRDAIDDLSTALYISPQYERVFGFPPEARLHDPTFWVDHLHPEDRDRVLELSKWTNETGEPFSAEYRFLGAGGRVVWVRDEAELLRDADGNPMLWQGVLLDVTARKQAEAALSRRDAVLEAIGFAAERFLKSDWESALPEVLERLGSAAGAGRVYVFANETFEDGGLGARRQREWLAPRAPRRAEARAVLSYDQGYVRLRSVLSSGMELHGLTRTRPSEEREHLQADGVLSQIVVPVFVGDEWWGFLGFDDCAAERIWPPAEVDALKTAADTLGAAIGRARAEHLLADAEARYRAIVEHVPAAIYVDVPDGSMTTLYVSPQIEQIMGIAPERFLGDPNVWLDLMPDPEQRAEMRDGYLRAIEDRSPWVAEYLIRRPDGSEVWVHDETTFVMDEAGEPLFLQGVMYDVTERKRAEHALMESERQEREAAERLRAVDEMKTTFLAAVSHELRTPLTSILGLSLTLERERLAPAEQGDLLGRLAGNARKLDRLLKDLLDMDRLSRGIITPSARPTDVGELVFRVVQSLDVVEERSILMETRPVVVPADPAKIERIVENLVMNAARHTPTNTAIWVRVLEHVDGAVIAVEDDGPGVPSELATEIFQPFRQGPTSAPHSPGTGIGLSLVAMFAELHGGRAWVEDREGGGASFRVFLPASGPVPVEGNGNGYARGADTVEPVTRG